MDEKKDKKDSMVDYPEYNPNERVPFPPGAGTPGKLPDPSIQKAKPAGKDSDYYTKYNPGSETPDPSKTTPGAPDLTSIHTRLTDEEAKKLNPDVELDKKYKNP